MLTLAKMTQDVADQAGLDAATLDVDADLLTYGLDSVMVMKLAAAWGKEGSTATFRELIEFRTLTEWHTVASGDTAPGAGRATIDHVDETQPFDLNWMQRAYWLGRGDDQPLGGVGAHFYNEFDGAVIDPARLEAAIEAVIERHSMLRARFTADGQQQVVASSWSGLIVNDLRTVGADELDARLDAIRDEVAHLRLHVDDGEVFDIRLSLLPDGTTRMHVHIEMLVADAHSFRVLLGDLAALYVDPAATLPPIAMSYATCLAHRRANPAPTADAAREYWLDRLDSLPGPPDLPFARRPDEITKPRVQRRHRRIDANDWARLAEQARARGLTLPIVFLSAFASVLARWSATKRFLLDLPTYDRDLAVPGIEHVVGDFTNITLLDVDCTEAPAFAELATTVQAQLQRDVQNLAFSGVEVLREMARTRGSVVQAPVVFTSAIGLGELFSDDVRTSFGAPTFTSSQTPQVWLDFQITEREGELFVNWDAVEGLLADGVLDAMFDTFSSAIDELAADATVWDTPIATTLPSDQQHARRCANDTAGVMPSTLLHERFFGLAESEPDALAVVCGPDTLTYAELAHRARAVAADLRSCGAGVGSAVAVTMPKSVDQIVGVLGVLAIGGTYVPIAADHPVARRTRIMQRAGTDIVLVNNASASLEMPPDVVVSNVRATTTPPVDAVVTDQSLDDTAYILFTSGSTGEPKGVRVSHRAAMNTIDAIDSHFEVGADDRTLGVSALNFDLSVYDIFAPLSVGGALILVDDTQRRDPIAWLDLIASNDVTVLNCVPALLDMLLAAAETAPPADRLRLVLLGGDWVGIDLPPRLHAQRPECRFVALGGTTETAIHSTVQEVTGGQCPPEWTSVIYGTPLRNVRCRVVDADGLDAPDWVAGELWIGGTSVADGYHGDPDRTARQFVRHDGQDWYRTGDMARYLPDGAIEFLGRSDFQVKINGHRIELGEIEVVLEAHADVRMAAAMVREGPRPQLAAVVQPTAGRSADLDVLRSTLRDELPAYMVPETLVVVDPLPLTANGKIDRSALAGLVVDAGPTAAIDDGPAAGPVEIALADAWVAVLGCDTPSRATSFFALGGDSLAATRVVNALGAQGLQLSLSRIFEFPVLAELATHVSEGQATEVLPTIEPAPADRFDPFAATDVQMAYWLGRNGTFTLSNCGTHWYLEFAGSDIDLDRLETAIQAIVDRHDMLRAVFDTDGRQRVLEQVPPFRISRSHGAADQLDAFRDRLSHRAFDTASWPLFDVQTLTDDGGSTTIAISFDYIVLDALSIMLVLSELSARYEDPERSFDELELTFRDYVEQVEPSAVERDRAWAYWSDKIDDLPGGPQLPLAVAPDAVAEPRFSRRETYLPKPMWDEIQVIARGHGLTGSAVLATTFAEVLAAWSIEPSLSMMMTLFDRRPVHPQINEIVGDFTSLMVVPYTSGPDTFAERCRAMQAELSQSLEHRGVSALDVLREVAQRTGRSDVAVPVVFTSTLGLGDDVPPRELSFGRLAGGLSQTPQVWLDHQVTEFAEGLFINWDAVDELFAPGMVDDMFGAYVEILEGLVDTDRWAAPMPSLVPTAQLATRSGVNATSAPVDRRILHDGFLSQVAATPERLAVTDGSGLELTYGELDRRARSIAGALIAAGVEHGDLVGVSLPKSCDQIAAVFGVLYAGAGYVPIGVDQPAMRRDAIIERADLRAIVAQTAFESASRATVLSISEAAASAPIVETVAVTPDDIAYVIFTSGSTGEPKGVVIAHEAATNTVEDINERFEVGPADRTFAISALDFDLSVYDIFGLLSVGGAVVMPAEHDRKEPSAWLEQAARYEVTIWNSVPALLDMAAVAARSRSLPTSLRLALVSGDWVGLDLLGKLRAAGSDLDLVALGGATEASIWSNMQRVDIIDPDWSSIPYGRPLRNQQFRVADVFGRDRPDWVPGELWIGGLGVAVGYQAAPELTDAQFVTHEGTRWYRTGDRGRYWPDGTLEFLGRVDHQVKIRGHRIELGEVQAGAEAVTGVTRAVVIVDEAAAALTAFFTTVDGGDAPTAADVLRGIAERVPAYMVPERAIALDELPLTKNGKVDRKALVAMVAAAAPIALDPADAPQGATEATIADLWSELLAHAAVGRSANFFALGGNSLRATELAEGLRLRFGVEVSLRDLLGAPTVSDMAQLVDDQIATDLETMEEGVVA